MKILFLINSLRGGGAEKVLVNLVNGMDSDKYDITILSLFGTGVNAQFLHDNIILHSFFKKAPKGIYLYSKLLSPRLLHSFFVKDRYDIEVSYLQGICSRIVLGAPDETKKICWLHNCDTPEYAYKSKSEMQSAWTKYDQIVSVSKMVDTKLKKHILNDVGNTCVIYNTQDIYGIVKNALDPVPVMSNANGIKIVTAGTLYDAKGYPRLLKVLKKLNDEGLTFNMYFVGDGPQRNELEDYVKKNDMSSYVTFFGFDKNPYKYMAKADLFVCSSYTEGFSGTVSEATILGIPTLTTRCAGMDEIFGENNEYGVIVDNTDEALYQGLYDILSNPELLAEYKERVKQRKDFFNPKNTIKQAEDLFDSLMKD